MKKKLKISLIGLFIFFTGCSAIEVNYHPTPLEDIQEAKNIIQQVILEQPGGRAPNSLEINNDYIQTTYIVTKTSGWTGGIATIPVKKTLYFNNIKSADLYYRRGIYSVMVIENSGETKLRVVTREEKKGKLFIDALKTLEDRYYSEHKPGKP